MKKWKRKSCSFLTSCNGRNLQDLLHMVDEIT
jgi:hypothetical protein